MKKFLILLLSSLLLSSQLVYAQEDALVDDAFDPFADYSDFVEASTEETDVNFFKFGRMLSFGGILGYRTFTDVQGDFYESSNTFGGFFTYYMSLQFAMQLSYSTGNHTASFASFDEPLLEDEKSTATFNVLSLHGKYFIKTQNLTKAISRFNPYIVGGFSNITVSTSAFEQPLVAARSTVGSFDFGVGGEYLFNNNKNFVSLQLMYYKADFGFESVEIKPTNTNTTEPQDTGIFLKGDPLVLQVMIGFNF